MLPTLSEYSESFGATREHSLYVRTKLFSFLPSEIDSDHSRIWSRERSRRAAHYHFRPSGCRRPAMSTDGVADGFSSRT